MNIEGIRIERIEIPIEKIVDGEVVMVDTKSIPIMQIKGNKIE